jgi:hypothetical protein
MCRLTVCVFDGGETISSDLNRLLEEYGSERIHSDVETKAYQGKDAHDQYHGRDKNEERDRSNPGLQPPLVLEHKISLIAWRERLLTVWRAEDLGVTFVPGKNVANRLAKIPSGGGAFTASASRTQAVSCRKRRQAMIVKPRSPTVHQNSKVHERLDEMYAESVGPATLPKFKHQ